jgi:hypothetical protein
MYTIVGLSGHIYGYADSEEQAGRKALEISVREMTNLSSFRVVGPMECPTCGHGKPPQVPEQPHPECTCSIDGTTFCKAQGTGYCKAENP